ncbi:MAG: DUF305 domain-containing protein [Anaerolineae bacterium]|nr:DUF305 domain-containing protein [Anaerolineae bacterium]MDW8173703.1 DUF305 domain-containing protein [Anaerolineae bacterium]
MKTRLFNSLIFALSLLLALPASAQLASSRTERAEIRFLQGMIDHHQLALDMANDCLDKPLREAAHALCQAIIAAQTSEIEQMVAWLDAWYGISYAPMSMLSMMATPTTHGSHAGHGAHGGGKVTDPASMMGMFAGFNRLEGRDYEIAWLESMIDHHDDAIHMSERLLAREPRAELRALAEAIIRDQRAEIELMETMLAELEF